MPKNIIIVEDQEMIREILNETLTMNGYTVIEAANGQIALEKIVSADEMGFPIDLLITDIKMPGMTGLELIDKLNSKNIFMPILAITGFSDKEIIIKLLRKGCKDYLEKPFSTETLLKHVKELFDNEKSIRDKMNKYVKKVEKEHSILNGINAEKVSREVLMDAKETTNGFIIDVEGRIESRSAILLKKNLEKLLDSGVKELTINLTSLEYINSYGVGAIVFIWKRIKEKNGNLNIISGNSRINKKLSELNLERVIKIYSSIEEFELDELK